MEGNGPTLIAVGLFILMSIGAVLIIRLVGKFLFRESIPSPGILLAVYAAVGGILGICMHFYAKHYMAFSQDEQGSSLFSMFGMFALFVFSNMVIIPLFIMALKMKNRRIKILEAELKKKQGS
jgi:hypothetical protein